MIGVLERTEKSEDKQSAIKTFSIQIFSKYYYQKSTLRGLKTFKVVISKIPTVDTAGRLKYKNRANVDKMTSINSFNYTCFQTRVQTFSFEINLNFLNITFFINYLEISHHVPF